MNKESKETIRTNVEKNLLNKRIYNEKTQIIFVNEPENGFKSFKSVIRYMFYKQTGGNYYTYSFNVPRPTKKNNRNQVLGSRRSIEDMYICCRTYFPDVKFDDVFNYIIETIPYSCYCGQHKKHMFSK